MVRVIKQRRYLTFTEAESHYPYSEAALRYMRFKSKPRKDSKGNNLETNLMAKFGVFVSVGSRVFIDSEAMDKFMDAHREFSAECSIE